MSIESEALKSPDVAVAPPERPDPEAVVIVTPVMSPVDMNVTQEVESASYR